MINANECKVGNRFIRELHNERGLEYDHDFVLTEEWMGKLFGSNIGIALQDLFPIPLTPEILEACGFRLDSESQYRCAYNGITRLDKVYAESIFSGDDPNLHIDCIMDAEGKEVRRIGVNGFVYLGMYGNAGTPVDLKYLHQLQNCYYFLTNKELIYQP